MNVQFENGTPRQHELFNEALADCTYPFARLSCTVFVRFSNDPDPDDSSEAAYTTWDTGDGVNAKGQAKIFRIKIIDSLEQDSGAAFFKEVVVHELGHVVQGHLSERSIKRLCNAFGGTREQWDRGDGTDDTEFPWEARIQEAFAEFFKDVYLGDKRVNPNRTNWQFPEDQYDVWTDVMNKTTTLMPGRMVGKGGSFPIRTINGFDNWQEIDVRELNGPNGLDAGGGWSATTVGHADDVHQALDAASTPLYFEGSDDVASFFLIEKFKWYPSAKGWDDQTDWQAWRFAHQDEVIRRCYVKCNMAYEEIGDPLWAAVVHQTSTIEILNSDGSVAGTQDNEDEFTEGFIGAALSPDGRSLLMINTGYEGFHKDKQSGPGATDPDYFSWIGYGTRSLVRVDIETGQRTVLGGYYLPDLFSASPLPADQWAPTTSTNVGVPFVDDNSNVWWYESWKWNPLTSDGIAPPPEGTWMHWDGGTQFGPAQLPGDAGDALDPSRIGGLSVAPDGRLAVGTFAGDTTPPNQDWIYGPYDMQIIDPTGGEPTQVYHDCGIYAGVWSPHSDMLVGIAARHEMINGRMQFWYPHRGLPLSRDADTSAVDLRAFDPLWEGTGLTAGTFAFGSWLGKRNTNFDQPPYPTYATAPRPALVAGPGPSGIVRHLN